MADIFRNPVGVNRRDFPPVLHLRSCAVVVGSLLVTTLAPFVAPPVVVAPNYGPLRASWQPVDTSRGTPKTLLADSQLPEQAFPQFLVERVRQNIPTPLGSASVLLATVPPAPFTNPPQFLVEKTRQNNITLVGTAYSLLTSVPPAPIVNPIQFSPDRFRPVIDTSRGSPKPLLADKQLPFFNPPQFAIARTRQSYDTTMGSSLSIRTTIPPSVTITVRTGSWIRYKKIA